MGLMSQCDYDGQAAEVNKERLFVIIRLDNLSHFYRDRRSNQQDVSESEVS